MAFGHPVTLISLHQAFSFWPAHASSHCTRNRSRSLFWRLQRSPQRQRCSSRIPPQITLEIVVGSPLGAPRARHRRCRETAPNRISSNAKSYDSRIHPPMPQYAYCAISLDPRSIKVSSSSARSTHSSANSPLTATPSWRKSLTCLTRLALPLTS